VSKFQSIEAYQQPLAAGYRLLPFNFMRLRDNQYVLTNQAGEFLVLDRQDIEHFVHHRLDPLSAPYQHLKSKHFLIDGDSNVALDLLPLKLRTRMHHLSEFTGLHIFVVSLRCEHSCPYCQVSRKNDNKPDFDMAKETADKALAMTFRSPSPVITIEFQGGEPLLNFELIRYITLRAEEINLVEKRQLRFVIATNLALVTDDILEFCKAHNILISTSLDGPRDLHNSNRPRPGGDSYERTIAGIRRARAVLGRDRVSALMTTTSASLGRVNEIIDEYLEQEMEGIFLRPLSPYGFAIKTKYYRAYKTDEWLKFYFDGLDYILQINKDGYPFAEHYASLILTKMLTPFSTGYVDLMSPSGIGIAAVVYNYDGDVYASDEGRMLAEMKDKTFCIGNLDKDSYEDIFTSEKLLDPLEASFSASAPMCNECVFEPFCGADPVFHHATQRDYVGHKPTSEFCHRNMAIFRRLIALMQDDAATKDIFHRWIRA
jgi:His-Xaa-Ser system radical SAM maturase HxsB